MGKSMWTTTKSDETFHYLWTTVDSLLKVLGTTSR